MAPAWRWDIADQAAYPQRSYTVQCEETDLDFLRRLLADEGLFCWFEHLADEAEGEGASFGRVRLVRGAFDPRAG